MIQHILFMWTVKSLLNIILPLILLSEFNTLELVANTQLVFKKHEHVFCFFIDLINNSV